MFIEYILYGTIITLILAIFFESKWFGIVLGIKKSDKIKRRHKYKDKSYK